MEVHGNEIRVVPKGRETLGIEAKHRGQTCFCIGRCFPSPIIAENRHSLAGRCHRLLCKES